MAKKKVATKVRTTKRSMMKNSRAIQPTARKKAPTVVPKGRASLDRARPLVAKPSVVRALAETPEEATEEIKDETRVHEEGEG